jgi:MFS family permease
VQESIRVRLPVVWGTKVNAISVEKPHALRVTGGRPLPRTATTSEVKCERSAPRGAIEALNFFMADAQAGIGPFLGVFLQARGWGAGAIGAVMTIGGIAGMVVTAPAGALVDRTTRKREYIVVSCVFTLLASALIWVSQGFWVIAASQVATAIAGAAIGPGVIGLTLGIFHQDGFNRQNGRNQAFNHAGNMVGAALSGFLGWRYGFVAIFWLAAVFAVLAIISVLLIPRSSINDRIARGLTEGDSNKAEAFRVLLEFKPLLILAASLALFHLGNAAMLPLYGLAVVAAHQGNPAAFVATTIVVAQGVMIITSLIAMRLSEARGYWLVILITFLALPIRGLIAASIVRAWGVFPVQILDGIGAGMQSVAVPGLVARMLNGTGRVNVGQGAVMTMQGIGAALSPALGGFIAQHLSYRISFLTLGSFAIGSVVLWISFRSSLKKACAA